MIWPRTVILTWKIGTQPFRHAWHSGLWWCTIIPSLVAYGSVVRKITSGQRCDRRTDRPTGRQPVNLNPIYPLPLTTLRAWVSLWLLTPSQPRRIKFIQYRYMLSITATTGFLRNYSLCNSRRVHETEGRNPTVTRRVETLKRVPLRDSDMKPVS